jgi:thiosulfate reductase cytochrome b subunit
MIDNIIFETETPRPSDSAPLVVSAMRHRLSTRIWHAINAAALLILLMSGLMIFNAHPRLYWGQYGANADAAWFEIGDNEGGGFLKIGDVRVATTGVLGVSTGKDGGRTAHAFPYWATLPSRYNLADARIWHLAFAWVLALGLLFYMIRALWNGHIRRDLHITRAEWSPRHIWRDIKNHAMLRFPKGASPVQYNILQKLTYISVIFIAIPLMIFTGLTMSPAMNAAWPWLTEIFGGRQSARSLHFIATFFLTGFFVVHMAMVLVSGPYGQIRSMITGRMPHAR